ncbi:MAG: DNA polymerase/3'-5' exonuclease PolX [Armatimonadetes bacterium]|nr:DNA polymerase/3'-5' exonuclease PolX [Armatimonadota bacterium]
MKNQQVAQVLNEIADLLELRGENVFRVGAYREAARQIEALGEPIGEIDQRGDLDKIPHVGASIAGKIHELLQTGHSRYLEQLQRQVPAGLVELMHVPGLGPKRARQLYDQLGVVTVADLKTAVEQHRVCRLPHFGEKSEANIRQAVEQLLQRTRRLLLSEALPMAERAAEHLRRSSPAERVDLAGSLRRFRETIGDLDLLAASRDPEAVLDAFTRLPGVARVDARGETKATVITEEGLQLDLRVVDPSVYGAALQYFTGSKAHNIKLRTWAEQRGLKISEYGVFRADTDERIAGATEEEVYACMGLPWIPPELREDRGELEAARERRLPELVALEQMRGDLQCHTKWSDGQRTIEEMVRAAESLGYEYLAITDHSQALGVAGGLSSERRREQRAEIEAVNRSLPRLRLLVGMEVDIRSDGALDADEEMLAACDVVVASLHSGLGQSREQVTRRVLAAIHHPRVHVLGHPTNRLIGRREGADLDLDAIIHAAAATGTALEINAQPDRLDLNDSHARRAVESGVRLVISTDAHSDTQLRYMRLGVATARRGWVGPLRVLNTRPLHELLAWLYDKRTEASG